MYRPPLELPITPLVPDTQMIADLPESFEEGIRLLSELADQSGPFHDGFHLADVTSMTLTHICQYVAPNIPAGPPHWRLEHAVGARYMTALLASLAPCVALAATLSATGEISVFDGGTVTDVEFKRLPKERNDQP
jgi:hypothetical protein